jgi:ABC-2 type transport system ATP-binding protein
MSPIVKVDGLHKSYGKTIAVDGISFEVLEGEIFGMVGPNGAGKTTTIECLEGLRKPDSGSVSVLGVDPQRDGQYLRTHTGMQLQQSALPDRIKVWEALDLYSTFYPDPADWEELLEHLGLQEKRGTPFAKLSGGQKQRLFVALALLPKPRLVFLDELTTGLDPQARHAVWDLIRDVRANGATLILTTHLMEEADELCDRVAILDRGAIVASGSPADLIRDLGGEERVTLSVDGGLPPAVASAVPATWRIEVQGERVSVAGPSGNTPLVVEVANLLASHRIRFRDLRTEPATLEDVFLKLTGRQMRE